MDVMKTLDIGLGLVFVYLVFALCVTALNEFLAALLSSRARWLRKGVTALLTPPGAKPANHRTDAVYRSPFLSALGRASGWTLQPRFSPSYVPPWTLVQGMLDAASPGSSAALGSFAGVKAAVARLPERSPIRVALDNLITQAGDDLGRLRKLVEEWFKTVEDQITAWYRQKTQYVLVALSLAMAVAMNLDTLAMVRLLSNDTKTRVALAEMGFKAGQADKDSSILDMAPLKKAQEALAAARAKGGSADELGLLQAKVDDELVALDKGAQQLVTTLAGTGVPMGWQGLDFQSLSTPDQLRKALGWLLTAFALSLGAPFWFDLLQKLTSIRSVGKNLLERRADG